MSKLITMKRAMEILGVNTAKRGDLFAREYGLSLVDVEMNHGKGKTRLFREDEVMAAAERVRAQIIQRAASRRRVPPADKWVPRESWLEAAQRIEAKLDRLLAIWEATR